MNSNFSKLPRLAVLSGLTMLAFLFGLSELAPTWGADLPSGARLLADARQRTETHITIRSQVRVATRLLGQPLVGSGEYAQLRASQGLLSLLQLTIQAGDTVTAVKQVNDGKRLWMHQTLGKTERVSAIDLTRVQRAVSAAAGDISDERPLSLYDSTNSLSHGGLPKLMEQLNDYFDFTRTPVAQGNLQNLRVLITTGVWKLDKLKQIAPEAVNQDKIAFEKIPPHLPHQVELQMGEEDLFPLRVTYQRWEKHRGQHELVAAVSLEFFDVVLGEELDPGMFNYSPSKVNVSDNTELYLQTLGLAERPTTASTSR